MSDVVPAPVVSLSAEDAGAFAPLGFQDLRTVVQPPWQEEETPGPHWWVSAVPSVIGNESPLLGDEGEKSPVTGDCHAGICGSRKIKSPLATRHCPVTTAASRLPNVSNMLTGVRKYGRKFLTKILIKDSRK